MGGSDVAVGKGSEATYSGDNCAGLSASTLLPSCLCLRFVDAGVLLVLVTGGESVDSPTEEAGERGVGLGSWL